MKLEAGQVWFLARTEYLITTSMHFTQSGVDCWQVIYLDIDRVPSQSDNYILTTKSILRYAYLGECLSEVFREHHHHA